MSGEQMLQEGIMPIGKFALRKLTSVPEYSMIWYANKLRAEPEMKDNLFRKVCQYFLDYVETNNVEKNRDMRRMTELMSSHYGEVGKREIFEVEIYDVANWGDYTRNILKNDLTLFVYRGKKLGEIGDKITLKATIKRHENYKGVDMTCLTQPRIPKETK